MAAPATSNPADALLGRVAVAAKMITMEQLAQATREQGRPGNTRNLGQVLLALGFVDEATLAKAIEMQRGVIARAKEKRAEAPAPAASEVGAESDARAARGPGPPGAPGAPAARGSAPRDQARRAARRARRRRPRRRPVAAPTPAGVVRIALDKGLDALLVDAASQSASDIHLHSGSNLRLRVRGALVEVPDAKLVAAARREADPARALRRAARAARGARRGRLRLHGEGPRALPRERLPPAARARRASSAPSRRSRRRSRTLGLPQTAREVHQLPPGHGADHRPGRLRQVLDAGGAGRPDQRGARATTSSRSRTRSSTCTRRSAASSTSARWSAHTELVRARAARRAARGPGRHRASASCATSRRSRSR